MRLVTIVGIAQGASLWVSLARQIWYSVAAVSGGFIRRDSIVVATNSTIGRLTHSILRLTVLDGVRDAKNTVYRAG